MNQHPTNTQSAAQISAPRDPRLDFFRGIAMFIIFIAHTPGNTWTLWIPARFGFSDATEIFVFCSGMASAIAFGKAFQQRGWWMGTARVSYRVWQVYWAHIGLFIALAGLLALVQINGLVINDYIGKLNLWVFYEDPLFNIPGLLTLTYVPNYFDILPMYLVILALMPMVMLAHRFSGRIGVFIGVVALWLVANLGYLGLPAEPWSDRVWFFNPFGWQLLFFTGFAWMLGWIPAPPVKRWLVVLCVAGLLVTIPFAYFRILREVPELAQINAQLQPLTGKTEFGLLRYIHFLAFAYVSWVAVGAGGKYLIANNLWGKFVKVVQKVGQQSLAVFLASLFLAQLIAMIRDEFFNRDLPMQVASNLVGFAGLIAVAYTVAWYKAQPWRKHKTKPDTTP
ncbi:OpgC family protein [Pseudovibrio flavus]|uniref:OpgC family protein n=1 Tax=Pseudovibrio flavus TaxID=2529854 RepID=UPI003526E447